MSESRKSTSLVIGEYKRTQGAVSKDAYIGTCEDVAAGLWVPTFAQATATLGDFAAFPVATSGAYDLKHASYTRVGSAVNLNLTFEADVTWSNAPGGECVSIELGNLPCEIDFTSSDDAMSTLAFAIDPTFMTAVPSNLFGLAVANPTLDTVQLNLATGTFPIATYTYKIAANVTYQCVC